MRFLVGESSTWSKAGWSRSCRGTFRYPDPQDDGSGFVARISEIAGRNPARWFFP